MTTDDIFSAFERFRNHLPIDGDLTLMILKGHLLIEEQVIGILQERLPPQALKEAGLTTHQRTCLAEAVVWGRGAGESEAWLWPALKKLNILRNDIAHKLTIEGIQDRITDFVDRSPRKLSTGNLCHDFEFALWVACAELHNLIVEPDPYDFLNPPEPELNPADFANIPGPAIDPADFRNVP